MIYLWRGSHSPQLPEIIKNSWQRDHLLILCPTFIKDFSFIKALPLAEIKFLGDWDNNSETSVKVELKKERQKINFPKTPVLGVFTTGTTNGSPRLILYSKNNIIGSLEAIRSVFDLNKIETLFCYPQPTHAFSLILGYMHSFLYDLKLITGTGRYSKTFHPLWSENKSYKCLSLGTPAHFEDLVTYLDHNNSKPIPTYSCIVGGSKTSLTHWNNLQHKLFIDAPSIGYGASEASLGVMHQKPGVQPKEDGEIGFPLPHINMNLIKDQGLEISGLAVSLATIQDGEISFPKTVLIRDDVEKRKNDETYLFRGRYELILNRGGFKLSLEHLEETLRTGGIDTVCVPVEDRRLGEELGIVSTSTDKIKMYETLHKFYGYKFNSENFIQVKELPLNGSAKVDRKKCSHLFTEKRVRE